MSATLIRVSNFVSNKLYFSEKKSPIFPEKKNGKHKWQNNECSCAWHDKNGNSKTLIKSIRRQQMWHRLVILRVTNTNSTTNLNFAAIIIIHGSITVTTDTCFLHIWPKMIMGVQTLGWTQTTTMLSTYTHFHAVLFSPLLVVNRASCGAHWTKNYQSLTIFAPIFTH